MAVFKKPLVDSTSGFVGIAADGLVAAKLVYMTLPRPLFPSSTSGAMDDDKDDYAQLTALNRPSGTPARSYCGHGYSSRSVLWSSSWPASALTPFSSTSRCRSLRLWPACCCFLLVCGSANLLSEIISRSASSPLSMSRYGCPFPVSLSCLSTMNVLRTET